MIDRNQFLEVQNQNKQSQNQQMVLLIFIHVKSNLNIILINKINMQSQDTVVLRLKIGKQTFNLRYGTEKWGLKHINLRHHKQLFGDKNLPLDRQIAWIEAWCAEKQFVGFGKNTKNEIKNVLYQVMVGGKQILILNLVVNFWEDYKDINIITLIPQQRQSFIKEIQNNKREHIIYEQYKKLREQLDKMDTSHNQLWQQLSEFQLAWGKKDEIKFVTGPLKIQK